MERPESDHLLLGEAFGLSMAKTRAELTFRAIGALILQVLSVGGVGRLLGQGRWLLRRFEGGGSGREG